ncbi:hypothetical protein VL20_2034 [Microcystis panniformis FACHB-1757]|uniref:Uncharacterized protein n=1 Tax=Microcystis panniformis FACHB-1757 TaxID=1638788 RepID=A0A0K1RZG0_9CHRO|nr:hypothetical protein VL20_2034 [Microcystis panniformis FACHB-1757]
MFLQWNSLSILLQQKWNFGDGNLTKCVHDRSPQKTQLVHIQAFDKLAISFPLTVPSFERL